MSSLKVATFNCENLFRRFKFASNADPNAAIKNGWRTNDTKFEVFNKKEKELTAKAIKETKADVIVLQEVEDMLALNKFRTDYFTRAEYPHILVIDGNDPRKIDIAVMSKYPIRNIETHRNDYGSFRKWYDFARDCLEFDVYHPKAKQYVRFFGLHLKSMLDKKDPCNGRRNTHNKRSNQAKIVKKIVTDKMKRYEGHFIILGDLNDYDEKDRLGKSAIIGLTKWNKFENVVKRLPKDEQWTHYYRGRGGSCKIPESYHQIDYILVSKPLAKKNPDAMPKIVRKGITKRATRYKGTRFPGVTKDTVASDHCPIVVELDL